MLEVALTWVKGNAHVPHTDILELMSAVRLPEDVILNRLQKCNIPRSPQARNFIPITQPRFL